MFALSTSTPKVRGVEKKWETLPKAVLRRRFFFDEFWFLPIIGSCRVVFQACQEMDTVTPPSQKSELMMPNTRRGLIFQ